jgi:uncharacterized protein (DUF488 family)
LILYTIGAYGFTADTFVEALRSANVTSLIDIRQRRAVRGPLYRFANATALESLIRDNGIAYVPLRTLAPTTEIRSLQRDADRSGSVAKRSRASLSEFFAAAYVDVVLGQFSEADLGDLLRIGGDKPSLFCVERRPEACHRSLAAGWIAGRVGCPVVDLISLAPF